MYGWDEREDGSLVVRLGDETYYASRADELEQLAEAEVGSTLHNVLEDDRHLEYGLVPTRMLRWLHQVCAWGGRLFDLNHPAILEVYRRMQSGEMDYILLRRSWHRVSHLVCGGLYSVITQADLRDGDTHLRQCLMEGAKGYLSPKQLPVEFEPQVGPTVAYLTGILVRDAQESPSVCHRSSIRLAPNGGLFGTFDTICGAGLRVSGSLAQVYWKGPSSTLLAKDASELVNSAKCPLSGYRPLDAWMLAALGQRYPAASGYARVMLLSADGTRVLEEDAALSTFDACSPEDGIPVLVASGELGVAALAVAELVRLLADFYRDRG